MSIHGRIIDELADCSTSTPERGAKADRMVDDDIKELSWKQLAEMATRERALRLSEEEKRRDLEQEMNRLKGRIEEREDLWLRALSKSE